jgi:nicotinamidase-related amidase
MRLPPLHILKRVAIVAAVAAASVGASLAVTMHRLTSVTDPEPGLVVGTRTALVVLDVQEEYTGHAARPPFPYADSETLIERINALTKHRAASNIEVVYVKQVYSDTLAQLVSLLLLGKRGWPGSAGAQLDPRLSRSSELVLEKPHADAFSSAQFRDFIVARQIGRLELVGLDGAGCIDVTARSAIARGLRVTIVQDAVASLEPDIVAQKRQDYPALGIELQSSQTLLSAH